MKYLFNMRRYCLQQKQGHVETFPKKILISYNDYA